ncbi:hypothetical protein [Solimonas sp. K1W22B-7]|uniref:hypothetical protein n=1 Tax=Solimonas sp. K1W22B-7 TaxID=2303331 RepID=UPI0013C4543E|nr:hypothetical protein [Solimonas sp. K1W22B-7]
MRVIEDAVLRIFADRQVPVGGQLALEALRAEWPRTQMRRSDLVQGVRALVFDGELELDEESEGPVLILTPRGQARQRAGRTVEAPRSLWSLLVPKKPEPMAGLRHHAVPEGDGYGRRKTDIS